VCNRNDLSLKNSQQEVMFIHKDRLRDSWVSPTRKYISNLLDSGQGMLQNQDNHHCQDCYDYEQAGKVSPRQTFNKLFESVAPLDSQPRVLIIKPGNVCNLACRMCNPETSSSWYTDSYKLAVKRENATVNFYQHTKKFEHIRNGFNKDNINFWNDLADWLPELVFLDIYGGEPLLSKELFDTLDRSPNPEKTSLQLHTNLTIYNEKYFEILSRYKQVNIGLSIDSHIATQLNYIRYPIDSNQILENLQKFKDFFKDYDNVRLGITCTVSNLNIFNIDSIQSELAKFSIPITVNFVHYPVEYDPRILPLAVKQQILEKNPKFKFIHSGYLLQDIDDAVANLKKFWQITKDLDEFRNQSFETIFTEYYDMLKLYL
jgi:sulfatase maturation enzyme AslB (radical SAM superfamily)